MKDLQQLQLNTLLEVTQAINNNVSEESLYKMFLFITLSNLKFGELDLLVKEDDHWQSKASKGLSLTYDEIEYLVNLETEEEILALSNFDNKPRLLKAEYVVKVSHKKSLLAFVVLGGKKKEVHTLEELTFVKTLANIIMVAIENKRLGRKELEQTIVKKELEVASKVQSLLLPKIIPDNELLSMHVSYIPHQTVGGDYYDYIPLSKEEFIFCIADVSGKGVPAAILMSNFQAALRALARLNLDLEKIANELNTQIVSNSEGMHFVTAFIGKINCETKKLTYINAGHNQPFLVNQEKVERLALGTTVLGALDELPFINIGEIAFPKGTFLTSFTDGVSETMNRDNEEFGDEPLEGIIREHCGHSLPEIHDEIIADLYTFKQDIPFNDDMTLLSIRMNS